jgi:hypothetical protein
LGSLPKDEPAKHSGEWGVATCYLSTTNPEVSLRAEAFLGAGEPDRQAYYLYIDTQNRKGHKDDPAWPRRTVHEHFHLTKTAYQQILAKTGCPVLEARVRAIELAQPLPYCCWVENFVYQDSNGRPLLSLLEVHPRDHDAAEHLALPEWFGKEVTDDPDYTPRAIWERLVSKESDVYKEREAV